jgi:hypothetical protein
MLAYLVCGAMCALLPPSPTASFDEHRITAGAKCARVTRHADYATVDLAFGTPFTLLHLLLRLDIVNLGDAQANMRLFSNKVSESDTVSCVNSLCHDAVLLSSDGPDSDQERYVASFLYTNAANEAQTFGTATTLGLDGELSLGINHDYYFTATHFCWSAVQGNGTAPTHIAGGVTLDVSGGILAANLSSLASSPSLRMSPVGRAHSDGACANTSSTDATQIALFPVEAANEASWLGLASSSAYEKSPDGVEDRRVVVEIGTACASTNAEFFRAYSLYLLDCSSIFTACEVSPTVPYRRVADTSMRLFLGAESAVLWTHVEDRLSTLPKLENGGSAMFLSIVKLSLMTLAAGVTWVRAAKSTSSHDRLLMHCIRTTRCQFLRDTEPVNEVCFGLVSRPVFWPGFSPCFLAWLSPCSRPVLARILALFSPGFSP